MTIKYDSKKLRPTLLPVHSINKVIEVLEFGAKKYAVDNWKTVVDAESRYLNAMLRHVMAVSNGEVIDEDSGLQHMAHAVCCGLFHLWFTGQGESVTENDKKLSENIEKLLNKNFNLAPKPTFIRPSFHAPECKLLIADLIKSEECCYNKHNINKANVVYLTTKAFNKFQSENGFLEYTNIDGENQIRGLKIIIVPFAKYLADVTVRYVSNEAMLSVLDKIVDETDKFNAGSAVPANAIMLRQWTYDKLKPQIENQTNIEVAGGFKYMVNGLAIEITLDWSKDIFVYHDPML